MRVNFSKLIYLINNQHFSDGLRITFSILVPALILSQIENVLIAFPVCLGTICVSITDTPGAWEERKKGMLITCAAIFATAVITGFVQASILWMAVEVVLLCFICSMLTVYGLRITLLGTATLLVMILLMNKPLPPVQIIRTGFLVLGGGLWYFLVCLFFFLVRPYGHAQKALGECMIAIGDLLIIKSRLYQKEFSIKEIFQKVLEQQIKINDLQELCREQILRSKFIMENENAKAKKLIASFITLQDLYENFLATHFDYETLRVTAIDKTVLIKISEVLAEIGDELKVFGNHLESGQFKAKIRKRLLENLNIKINEILNAQEEVPGINEVKIRLVKLQQHITELQKIIISPSYNPLKIDYLNFKIPNEPFTLQPFIESLSLNSSIFRHAIRVTIVGLAGFLIGKLILAEGHSYWILLTSIFILKPSYSLSKQRNFQRVLGTVLGAVIGFVVLYFIQNKTVLLVIMGTFMVAAYTAQRINYILLILFITPYIFIIFNFLGVNVVKILEERVEDTLIGCFLSLLGTYLILPHWESDKIRDLMKDLVKANINYFHQAIDFIKVNNKAELKYRYSRKEVFITTANIQGAYQRMKSEPTKVRFNLQILHEFIVLNQSLSSFIAGLNGNNELSENIKMDHLNHYLQSLERGIKNNGNSNTPAKEIKENNGELNFQNRYDTVSQTISKINDILKNL